MAHQGAVNYAQEVGKGEEGRREIKQNESMCMCEGERSCMHTCNPQGENVIKLRNGVPQVYGKQHAKPDVPTAFREKSYKKVVYVKEPLQDKQLLLDHLDHLNRVAQQRSCKRRLNLIKSHLSKIYHCQSPRRESLNVMHY